MCEQSRRALGCSASGWFQRRWGPLRFVLVGVVLPLGMIMGMTAHENESVKHDRMLCSASLWLIVHAEEL